MRARFPHRGPRFAPLIALLPSLAPAADWQQIDRNPQKDSLWVDLDSVRREGSLIRYSERMDFATPRKFADGSLVSVIWSTYLIDCPHRTRAIVSFLGASPKGKLIGVTGVPKEPKFAAFDDRPQSPDAIAFTFVCGLRKPAGGAAPPVR